MAELRITPRPGFTMTVDRRWALELFDDMERSGIADQRNSPTTDAFRMALRKALAPAAPTAERLTWGPGTWIKLVSGDHVWRKRIVHPDRPAESGLVLARIVRFGPDDWEPRIHPHGTDAVDRLRPRKTLREAKEAAMHEFAALRRVIEKNL